MNRNKLTGTCHCGNITFEMELAKSPENYSPRACDCSFCQKHCAAYLSDPQGQLRIQVKDKVNLNRYRQGSDTADFLLCRNCGILVGAIYEEGDKIYGVVNSHSIDGNPGFLEETVVSPAKLDSREKVQRWKYLWFPDVSIS